MATRLYAWQLENWKLKPLNKWVSQSGAGARIRRKRGSATQSHFGWCWCRMLFGYFYLFRFTQSFKGVSRGLTTLIRPRWKGKTSADRTHRGPCLKVNSFNLITVDFIAASQIDASGFECGCGHGCGCGCGCGRKGKRKRNGAKDPGQPFCGRTAETVGESLGCCVRIFRVR